MEAVEENPEMSVGDVELLVTNDNELFWRESCSRPEDRELQANVSMFVRDFRV